MTDGVERTDEPAPGRPEVARLSAAGAWRTVSHRVRRVVVHVFAMDELFLSQLVRGWCDRPLRNAWALAVPLAIHVATAGNDVLAALSVAKVTHDSGVAFGLEAVFTALIWVGHLLARGD